MSFMVAAKDAGWDKPSWIHDDFWVPLKLWNPVNWINFMAGEEYGNGRDFMNFVTQRVYNFLFKYFLSELYFVLKRKTMDSTSMPTMQQLLRQIVIRSNLTIVFYQLHFRCEGVGNYSPPQQRPSNDVILHSPYLSFDRMKYIVALTSRPLYALLYLFCH